jgi:hypothetical protein
MRIDYRYGAAVGILAAAFATLGPVAAQAGQTPGTSVPTCAGACGLEAPAVHITGIASRSIVLTSTVERSSYNYGYDRYQFGFLGHRDRVVVKSDGCNEDWWAGAWHRACKCRFGEFKDVSLIKPIKPVIPIIPIKPCKHVNHFRHGHYGHGHFRYGQYGHGQYGHGQYGYGQYGHGQYGHDGQVGHVGLLSHDSGLS